VNGKAADCHRSIPRGSPKLQMLFENEEVRGSTYIFSVRDPVDRRTP
jgi:hypothetical protein